MTHILKTFVFLCAIAGIALGFLTIFKSDSVEAGIKQPVMTNELTIKKNKELQANRLADPDLNANLAFVTFLRFVSNMNKINPV